MLWRLGSSLRNRIAALAGLLFLAGITLITLIVTQILHKDMQDLVFKQQLTATRFVARDIEGKLQLRLESLKRVALNLPPALLADPAALQTWLDDRKAINTLFPTGLMIIPADGGPPLAETPRLENRPKSFADRDWFIGATTTRHPYFSKPLITRATGQAALVIAIPLFDSEQQLLAVMAGITPLATPGFLDLIIGARPSQHGNFQLIAPTHRLLALSSDSGANITPLPSEGEDPIIDQAIKQLRACAVLPDAGHGDELACIAEIPSASWLLIARQPFDEAFEPVRNTVTNTVKTTAILSLPIVVILLLALSWLLKPFARLAGEIHDMAEGTREMLPLAPHATDEVADLANSFNRLQGKLLAQERRLAQMAHHDILTGLPNRWLINDRLENELRKIPRTEQGLAVLFLDLDGFKAVNDQHGHQTGDRLLIEIARRLQACIRSGDTVGRLGGDEFLILLSHLEPPLMAAERVARQSLEALAAPIVIDALSITVGASIGIVVCTPEEADATSASHLMSLADTAMYSAKAAGRNRYVIHSPTHQAASPPHA